MATMGFAFKFARAHHHLNDLQRCVTEWFNGEHHTVVQERHPDGPGNYQVRVTVDDLPIDPFSLIIGDILFAIRSGLAQLAYALNSASGPIPEEFEHESEFPIFGDKSRKRNTGAGPDMFNSSGSKCIRWMDGTAQKIIESLQPYHRGKNFREHPLWQLHELCNIDKHRLLHPVIYSFDGMAMRVDECRNVEIYGQLEVYGGPLKKEAIVARFGASPIDPKLAMNVDFEPILGIAFPEGTCAANLNIVEALGSIHNFVIKDVVEQLLPFFPNHDVPP